MLALGTLAARHAALTAEVKALETELDRLTAKAAPGLVARFGVGPEVAGALLVAAGDNPGRLRSEAAFSMLCGSSPIPASSGKTTRTASTGAVTAKPTPPCIGSSSSGCATTSAPRTT
jgi:transposase